jgi:acyl carrier protein
MTDDRIRAAVLEALRRVAPEADPSAIAADADVREVLDIDSMDFLKVVVALHERLGVDVPEKDYARLFTIDGAVRYLADALRAR